MVARLLVIAGSDPSGGAGIQADLKTAQAHHVYAQTAITALTVQDTHKVHAVHPVAPEIVRGQIDAALNDIGADAIKIGMLGNGEIAKAVADALEGNDIPLVLDTVLLSSSGAPLLDAMGIDVLKARLILRAALITPNRMETQALTGIVPDGPERAREAARMFATLGAENILFKDGHGDGETVCDMLWTDGELAFFESPRQAVRHTHGTGCTLATAIACGLAHGMVLGDAVARAHAFVQHAIRTAPGLGRGNGPLNHAH